MKTIILCGLPGCGKTTVGLQLAQKTGGTFIDVDAMIENRYAETTGEGLTCRQIFVQKGSSFFRELEGKVIASLGRRPLENAIISMGGGAIENPENVEIFKSIGLVVYLKGDLGVLFKRINENGLPAYLNPYDPFGSFEKLAQKRNPLYSKAADIEVEEFLSNPEEMASTIISRLNLETTLERGQ